MPESKNQILEFTKEPLAGANLTNLLRLCAQNRFRIGWRYLPRFLYTLLICSVMGPFRVAERLKWDRAIGDTAIEHPPLFILGHWRSGTTYLHNVLSQDPRLGYFTTFQAYIPGLFLTGEKMFKPLVAASIPKQRPMDGVAMGADLPQEDQYAMGAFTPFSYYHGWCFPRRMDDYYRGVFLGGQPNAMQREWKRVYVYLLKKATLACGGRRLVLKNQDNTVHIPQLLHLFPGARFVHIHRHPYQVYASMMKFLRIAVPLYCLQNPPPEEVLEEKMMDFYARFFRQYLEDRALIPAGHLVEMDYRDFIQQPLEEVRRLYSQLSLPGYEEAQPRFREYLESQFDFRPDAYELDEDTRERVYRRWRLVFDAYGYQP